MNKPFILLLLAFSCTALAVPPEDLIDTRIGASEMTSRSSTVLRAFRRIHPCPSTLAYDGPCAGWQIDHVVPRACGGKDSVSNLQWLPAVLKSGPGKYPKDRWERKINCPGQQIIIMPVSGVLSVSP